MRSAVRNLIVLLALVALLPSVAGAQQPQSDRFQTGELVDAGHRFFGGVSRGLATVIEKADNLIVLQEQGPASLPPAARRKAHVIYQSTASRKRLPKTDRHLRAVMVGHLRDEKDPRTLFDAARRLRERADIRIDRVSRA